MAGRRPGGQPGNRNARGHRGANQFSGNAASDRQRANRARSNANPRPSFGQRLKGRVRANIQHVRRNKLAFAKRLAKGAARTALLNASAPAVATAIAVGIRASQKTRRR